jgi:hypothetical protein
MHALTTLLYLYDENVSDGFKERESVWDVSKAVSLENNWGRFFGFRRRFTARGRSPCRFSVLQKMSLRSLPQGILDAPTRTTVLLDLPPSFPDRYLKHQASSQAILILYARNMWGCNVCITDVKELWSTPLTLLHVVRCAYEVSWRLV